MDQNRITNSFLEEQEITAAKTGLEMSVQRFGMALDNLANRVGVTADSIHQVQEMVGAPKRMILNAKGTIQDYSERAITKVRENPRPFLMVAVGVIGLGALLYYGVRRPDSLKRLARYL
ncbi:MAG: hypothetical protein A2622_07815 [Bdellovibrionales bacterium RIFCSPHIGHO2_01_FULL_40_29]|nr:MAG: hypothetical protein A2622_07815 [Bdellovibrionales bacterium RIFCSPHIGHO2_01_FULL_40_29]OFZ33712.1 MAG: hypothetical protein A3D17_09905 [Bdellovibrionales bacterium RIFCSPHIGHO2_02_FULL_40_15]